MIGLVKAESTHDTGRIVEIAWKLFSDTGDCLESKQYLIKLYGTCKEIAPKARKFMVSLPSVHLNMALMWN
jgi:hypothetical protein